MVDRHKGRMFDMRPATPADAPFLESLERAVMESHALALWGRYLPATLSAFDLSNTRIVLTPETPVGYVLTERGEQHLRLRKLYLAPSVQGRGWGRQALSMVRHEATTANLTLRLSVLRPNTRALAFYLREGLTVVDTTAERLFLEMPRTAQSTCVLESTASPL